MSLSLRGYSGSDSDKPPNYWVVDESEVVIKDREIRSQKPDGHYQLSSPVIRRSHDKTVPLDDGLAQSTPIALNTSQPLEVSAASYADNEFWTNLNRLGPTYNDDPVFPKVSNTPTVHELGGRRIETATHTTVVYADVIVTTVPTSLTPTAPPSSISIPSPDSIGHAQQTVSQASRPTHTLA